MRHALSDGTLEEMRDCLFLISARERELAEAAGRPPTSRPRYTDEPRAPRPTVVPLEKTGIGKGTKKP